MPHVHFACVLLALVTAGGASSQTSSQLGLHDGHIQLGQPGQDASRSCTDIGAVKIKADTVDEVQEMLPFAQAGVRTGRTDLGTPKAGFNAVYQHAEFEEGRLGMAF
ncbi:hypothetical protein ACFFLM_15505 [Deinococcus oregonensis]|uniref:Uncharacterized protein n=1 Tax=Deinococcus oregonensis TaxID=1805970 RepID=A0ABV6B0T7_9DEIO